MTERPLIFDPTTLSKDSGLSGDEKKLLRAPIPQSEVRVSADGKRWTIDVKLWDDREITLASPCRDVLKHNLKYFKSMDRKLINGLMSAAVIPFTAWKPVGSHVCTTCGDKARINPCNPLEWGCVTCDFQAPARDEAKFLNPTTPKVKVKKEAKPKSVVVEKPTKKEKRPTAEPRQSLSLAERMALRKKAQS